MTRRISASRPMTGSKPPGAGLLHEVPAVALEGLVGALGGGARDALAAAHFRQGRQKRVARDAELLEGPGGGGGGRCGTLINHRQRQVLDRDVLVLEALGLVLGPHEHFVQAPRQIDLARLGARAAHLGAADQFPLDLGQQGLGRGVHLVQEPRQEALRLRRQGRQQVLDIDLLVAAADRAALRIVQGFLAFLGQAIEVHVLLRCAAGEGTCLACPQRLSF